MIATMPREERSHIYTKARLHGFDVKYLSDYSGILIAPDGTTMKLDWDEMDSFIKRAA